MKPEKIKKSVIIEELRTKNKTLQEHNQHLEKVIEDYVKVLAQKNEEIAELEADNSDYRQQIRFGSYS